MAQSTAPRKVDQLPKLLDYFGGCGERANDRPIDFRIFREVNSLEETHQAGAEILTPGDTSRTMYILKKGAVAVQIHNVTVEQI